QRGGDRLGRRAARAPGAPAGRSRNARCLPCSPRARVCRSLPAHRRPPAARPEDLPQSRLRAGLLARVPPGALGRRAPGPRGLLMLPILRGILVFGALALLIRTGFLSRVVEILAAWLPPRRGNFAT